MVLLLYSGVAALTIVTGLLFGIAVSAVVVLTFSAILAGYLTERYTTSFAIATFAKATCMALFLAGISMLVVGLGWWGLTGIVGYWLVLMLSRLFWHGRELSDR